MQQAGPSLAEALKSGERREAHATRLGGLDLGPQVTSWALDASYGTDLPDAMRAYSGASSAQIDLELTGRNGVSAPALYGPWAPHATADAVRPGQSVTHRWGLGTYTMASFRGTVRARSAKSGTDSVLVTALDGAERLRMPAQLPRPSGGLDEAASGIAATDWVGSATWCVDHLLRRAGIHTSPPPRSGCIMYASYHGGAAASVGTLTTLSGGWNRWSHPTPPYTAAALGPRNGFAVARYAPAIRGLNRNLKGTGYWYETFFDTTDTAPSGWNPYSQARLEIHWTTAGTEQRTSFLLDWSGQRLVAAAGAITTVPEQNPQITWSPPEMGAERKGRWHVGFWITVSDAGTVTVAARLTGPSGKLMTCAPQAIPGYTLPPGAIHDCSVVLGDLAVEALQLTPMAAVPSGASVTQDGQWTLGAKLDVPTLPLTVLPVVSGSAWDVITTIAKATLSTAEFKADGMFVWRSASRWATAPTAPDLTVTSARELAALTVTEEIDSCRNYLRVKWQNWATIKAIARERASITTLTIPTGATVTVRWEIGEDELDPLPPVTTTAGTVQAGGIRFCSADSDNAPVLLGAVEVGVGRADGLLTMTLTNRSASTVYCRRLGPDSVCYDLVTPVLPNGVAPVANWAVALNTISQLAYGRQVYDHDTAGWVQESTGATALATTLLTAGRYPIPLLADVEILADPRIELGDVVRVVDTTGAQLDTLAWVVGNRVNGTAGGVKQTLTLRGTASPGPPTDTGLTPDPPYAP
ncbi:hypothetical protein OHV05_04370 [Kitasatospora sp. NBC_00070]|uniref:hypothetical protein n=1 Tax=Kitasatospora sp. NBC_00070 TaxID=2975962 RepID=UPI0032550CF0